MEAVEAVEGGLAICEVQRCEVMVVVMKLVRLLEKRAADAGTATVLCYAWLR